VSGGSQLFVMVSIRGQNGTMAGFAPLHTCVGVVHWRDTHVVRRRQMCRFRQVAAHRGEPDPWLAGAWLMVAMGNGQRAGADRKPVMPVTIFS